MTVPLISTSYLLIILPCLPAIYTYTDILLVLSVSLHHFQKLMKI